MTRTKSKAKAKQAKPVGDRGSPHHGRVDHRKISMALPLPPAVRARFPKDFDAAFYARPSQRAIGKVIFVLFGPYLRYTGTTWLSQLQAHHLVQQNYAEAMSQVRSGNGDQRDTFWVERENAVIKFESRAVQTVRAMPVVTVSFHLWTLWALDTFSTKAARWTFIGHLLDEEMRNATPSERQSILHRLIYDAYRPFIESRPGGIQSEKDITRIVKEHFSTALRSVRALIPTLDGKQKAFAEQLIKWDKGCIIHRLQRIWEYGVFVSEESRSIYLAPPLTHKNDIRRLGAPSQCIEGKNQHSEHNQDGVKVVKTDDVPIRKPLSVSRAPEKQHMSLPLATTADKTARKRKIREEQRRNIYVAIRPFIEPHIDESLPDSKIEELVHECLKSQTFLNSIPIEEAITGVTKLWKGRAFHDSRIRSQLLGIEEVQENEPRIVIKREPMSPPINLAKIPLQGDQLPREAFEAHPRSSAGSNDAASNLTCQQRPSEETQNVDRLAYLVIAPVVQSSKQKSLSHEEIAAIVREVRNLPSFLTTMSEERAIDLVWDLLSRGAFQGHDCQQRRNILSADMGMPSVQYQDVFDGVGSALRPIVNLPKTLLPVVNPPKTYATGANTAASLGSRSKKSGKENQPLSMFPVQEFQPGTTEKPAALNTSTSSKSEASLAPVISLNGSVDTRSAKKQKLSAQLTNSLLTVKASSRTRSELAPTAGVKRSLDDLYRDHPEKALGLTKEAMLDLMATTIQHVAEEAVFEWLKRCCPMNAWPNVIRQISESNFDGSIAVPEEAACFKQSISGIFQRCRKTYRESDGHKNEDIVTTVNNAMELCLALKDNKRRASLEMVEDKIRAARSSLYSLSMEIKRQASEQLVSLNNSDLLRPSKRHMGADHQRSELSIIDEAFEDFEKHHQESSIELLTALKRLLDSSATNEPPASPIW